jgi:pyrroline-5-carboxylate reductase
VTIAQIEAAIGKPVAVVRVIPNTPSWIGEGMNPFCCGSYVGHAEKEFLRELLSVFGKAVEITEAQMAIATALTAVGPTYIFPVIAALTDAAVTHGIPASLALGMAAQVVKGAARLATESQRRPEDLSLMTSLRTLDEAAAKKLFTQAVEDAYNKVIIAEAKLAAAK